MFEKAIRNKFRFTSKRGNLTVEDLWDLPLPELDVIARYYNKLLKESAEESFIAPQTTKSAGITDRFEIVKYIISVKLAEQDARKLRAEKKARQEFLKEVLAEKQIDAVKDKSIEELQKEVEELQKDLG